LTAASAGPQESALGGAERSTGDVASVPLKWVGAPLGLAEQKGEIARSTALRQADDQLAWIQSVQFAPVQSRLPLEQLRFDTPPASLQPEGRALGTRVTPALDPAVESAAFRFVK
jgi:hypothetical protein